MCNQVSTTTLKFFDKPTKETHRGSLWKPASCKGHLPHSKPSRATFLKDEVLKRENNKLWHWTKKLWNRWRVHWNKYNDYPRISSDFLFSKRDPCAKRENRKGKDLIYYYSLGYWSDETHWLRFMKKFKEKLLQPSSNLPLATAPAPQGQISPQHAHDSQLHPRAALLPQ